MIILKKLLFYFSSVLLTLLPANTYTEGLTGQPQSFLPSQAISQDDKAISSLIYRGLFDYDIYGNLIPDLAESWAISNDGLVYTIKLKANQKWSDGTTINADDLIYTAFKLPDLSGVATDKVDGLTVRYILPNKFSPFLSLLTIGVMQEGSEERYNPLTPVSSGQFRVLNIEKNGPVINKVVLLNTRKEDDIKKVIFKYYSNEDEVITGAKLGEIQGFMTNKEIDLTNLPNFSDHKFPLQGVYFALFFNLDNENVQDVVLRQKLEKVLDINKLIANKGIFVQGPISRSVFTDLSLNFDKYDKEYKESLDVGLTMTIPDIGRHSEIALQIKDVWKDKLDVDLDIKKIDPNELVEKAIKTRDYEILLYGQEIGRDPDRYINWHSAQKEYPGLNLSKFDQIRADRALEEGRVAQENDERVIHYNEFQRVVVADVPAIFLYHPYKNFYVSKYVSGIGQKYTFNLVDRFLDFSNWKLVKTN